MFKKKPLVPREMNYYERNSVLSGIIPKDSVVELSSIAKKLSKIKNLKVLEYKPNSNYTGALVKCEYKGQIYNIEISRNGFGGESFPETYISQSYFFTEEEIKAIKSSSSILSIIMQFKKDPRADFQLQFKIIYTLVPDLAGVIDESAMKVIPPKVVKMFAESKYVMDPADLYLTHAVYEKDGTVWLHTHGLNRCGITELEILDVNQSNYGKYQGILNAFASYIIENNPNGFDPLKHSACIGLLNDQSPILVACIPWQEILPFYGNTSLGGVKDRKSDHNGFTSIIVSYEKEEDIKNSKIIKITDIKDKLNDNTILFYSKEETKRMSGVAKERIEAVYNAFKNKENTIMFKIGLPIEGKNSFEYIWFELIDIDKNAFKCKLTQEPFEVENIKVGDVKKYTLDDVTDWVIYTKERVVHPNNAYIFMD